MLGFVAEDGLAGKLDLVAFLADALDHDLLAFFQFVTHVADAPVGNFRDVQQAISAGEDFNEGAEINDAAHRSDVGCADFGIRGETLNPSDRSFGRRRIRSRDGNGAVVFDIDLRAGFLNQSADDFAAWSDDVANLVRIDLDLDDARRMLRN